MPETMDKKHGPFRLVKYFMISGFLVIAAFTFLLGAFLYSKNVNTLLQSSENYARLLGENLNYNIFIGFYAPLKARGVGMDLQKWDQFAALDSLVKDFTYGLRIRRIKIIDRQHKIIYSTDYDLIGKFEPQNPSVDHALNGKDLTVIREEKEPQALWLTDTYYPLREITGNFWMLGNIYGVLEISQDVTDQYQGVRKSIMVIILVAAGLMAFLFVMLTLIVRRGERILLERSREQKRLEQQLQQSEKLASIGQMVAAVAHEIRNPLGIIKSSADMLLRKRNPDPDRVQKLCGVIFEESTRLSNILTDFLEFARPKSPDLRSIDVRDVTARVRHNLDEEIIQRGVHWSETAANGVEPKIMGDSDQLYQAFLNIIINAFDAMERNGEIAISITPLNGSVKVDFIDNGRGIKKEHLENIFTPFFTTNEMGTGLGLSVVHNIITAHRGTISVSSEEGAGTRFSILLPATASQGPI